MEQLVAGSRTTARSIRELVKLFAAALDEEAPSAGHLAAHAPAVPRRRRACSASTTTA